MSAFISREPVAVTDGEGNTIWIKPKMDYGTRSRVLSSIMHISAGSNNAVTDVDMGAYNLALLKENITRWDGPAFDGLPFSPNLVDLLDPDLPLLDLVLAEINTRNTKAATPEKKLSAPAGNNGSTTGARRHPAGSTT